VLLVQKLTKEEMRLADAGALEQYPMFMAIPKTAGIDKRGNPVYFKTPDGFEMLDENMLPIVDDEITLVADHFADWVRGVGNVTA
jgi:hypothetical protein